MHEHVRYVNHLGEEIVFGRGNYFMDSNDLRDYSWAFSSGNYISNFTRPNSTKSLPITVSGKNPSELKNRLFETFEKDVIASIKGAFWIGDYYYRCFVYESKKSEYINDDGSVTLTMAAATDMPYWVREITTRFLPQPASPVGLKYSKKYSYRYADYNVNVTVTNNTLAPAPFILTIYGPCENPEVVVGSQRYKVNVTLTAQEYLTITSFARDQTIFMTDSYGIVNNIFDKRDKTIDDMFAPIPNGTYSVSWNGNFTFDLTVCDVRSEPLWV